jgi:phage replication O-like protein O
MVDPFTPLHHEVIEGLAKLQLSGSEFRVLLVVWRKTYGFQKKEDHISISQFVNATNLHRTTVCDALRALQDKKVINRSGMKTSFSKDFLRPNVAIFDSRESSGVDDRLKSVVNPLPTIDTTTKDRKKTPTPFPDQQSSTRELDFVENSQFSREKKKKSKLVPLTYAQIWQIAMDKHVSFADVRRVHRKVWEEVMGENKYKTKSINLTTRKWVDLALSRKSINPMTPEEEEYLKIDSPETMKKLYPNLEAFV